MAPIFDKFYCVGKIFNVYLLQNVIQIHKSMQTIRNEAMHIIYVTLVFKMS